MHSGAHPTILQLQSASGLEKKQNTVHSTDFKNAWFYTSTQIQVGQLLQYGQYIPNTFCITTGILFSRFSATFVEKK
jgi:hypothetical protein